MRRAALALLLLAASHAAPSPPDSCATVELFRDDFSRFAPGWLSNPVLTNGILNGAIQEYHYLPHRGVPLGPWANAIAYLDAWVSGDEDGVPYVEQHTVNALSALMSGRVYAPIRNPDYNDSNYRANVSLPRWREAASR